MYSGSVNMLEVVGSVDGTVELSLPLPLPPRLPCCWEAPLDPFEPCLEPFPFFLAFLSCHHGMLSQRTDRNQRHRRTKSLCVSTTRLHAAASIGRKAQVLQAQPVNSHSDGNFCWLVHQAAMGQVVGVLASSFSDQAEHTQIGRTAEARREKRGGRCGMDTFMATLKYICHTAAFTSSKHSPSSLLYSAFSGTCSRERLLGLPG